MDLALFQCSPVGHLTSISGTDGRARRPYEHKAFVPDPLGPPISLTDETYRTVSRASLALGRLDAASILIPNPSLLRRPTLRKEAQSTSALEGTFAPLEHVLADDEAGTGEVDVPNLAALREVLNYVRAADTAFAWIENEHPITSGLLMEAQRSLVSRTPAESRDPGRVRTIQVAIGAGQATPIDRARFVPMPPGVELETAVQDLTTWIQANDDRDPVVSAAMAHYQFETLHPFSDGNGRIGRLLIVLQLMADRVLRSPLLSVSPWFEARRDEYQEHLFNVSTSGAWDPWVRFFSAGLEASAVDTQHRIQNLLDLQRDHEQRLRDARIRGGIARDIVADLIGYPVFTIPSLRRRLRRLTPQAIASAVSQLVDLGIVLKSEREYRHQYSAPDVLEILR